MIDTTYARDVALPLKFDEDCNLTLDENEAIIDQAIHIIAFTRAGAIPLFITMGSEAQLGLFEPNDETTQLAIDSSLRIAFEQNESRVYLDREFVFDETADGTSLMIIIPYTIIVNGKLVTSRFIVPRDLLE